MTRQPKLMNFSTMRDIFEPHLPDIRELIFINRELAILYGDPRVFRLVLKHSPPFIIDDYRLGIIEQGEACININLIEKTLHAGTLVFLGPGTIISPIRFSEDLRIYGLGLSSEFPMPFAPNQTPQLFNGQVRDFQIHVSEADHATAILIVNTLWHTVHQPNYHRPTVSMLVGAQMHHYDALYRQHISRLERIQTREQSIFDRFIQLVNAHCQQQHRLKYYAERMCLTERYLGTVIRQASGTTAKEWIDKALTTHIKIQLSHTQKSAAQISEEFNFPNPSFFTKYFKRMTGHTPHEFRNLGNR